MSVRKVQAKGVKPLTSKVSKHRRFRAKSGGSSQRHVVSLNVSKQAMLLGRLEELESKDPTRFKEVLSTIAMEFRNKAEEQGSGHLRLDHFADKLERAARFGRQEELGRRQLDFPMDRVPLPQVSPKFAEWGLDSNRVPPLGTKRDSGAFSVFPRLSAERSRDTPAAELRSQPEGEDLEAAVQSTGLPSRNGRREAAEMRLEAALERRLEENQRGDATVQERHRVSEIRLKANPGAPATRSPGDGEPGSSDRGIQLPPWYRFPLRSPGEARAVFASWKRVNDVLLCSALSHVNAALAQLGGGETADTSANVTKGA